MKKEFILKGDVQSLYASTFEQSLPTLGTEEAGRFTDPLTADEEKLLVEKYLETPNVWQSFIGKYLEHYPLSTKAMQLLITHVSQPYAAGLVKYCFAAFGYTESDVRLFAKQACSEETRHDILNTISENPRIFDREVFQILEKYDVINRDKEYHTEYAYTYRCNTEKTRQHRYH